MRPPLFETTVFVARNGFFAVSRNQVSSAVFGFFGFLCFFKNAILEVVFRVSCGPEKFSFFLVFSVGGLHGALQEVVGHETLQNKGFRSNFALWYLVRLRWTRCIASMQHKFFENNIWGSHKLTIGFGRQKTVWGCRTEIVLKMTFFPFFPGRDQFVKFLARFGRAAVSRFGFESGRCQKSACGCGADGFPSFSGLFFRHRFCKFEPGSFETPLSSFRVLLFSAFSSWVWVDATLHVCFGAVGPKLFFFFFFVFLVSLFTKNVFYLKNRLFFFISQCLPFFLLGFIHFSFSLSLSLSLLFFFFCFLFVLLFYFVTFLDFCCSFLPCSLLLFHDNSNIKILDVKGIFSSIIFVSFGFPVLLSFQSLFLFLFHYVSSVFW